MHQLKNIRKLVITSVPYQIAPTLATDGIDCAIENLITLTFRKFDNSTPPEVETDFGLTHIQIWWYDAIAAVWVIAEPSPIEFGRDTTTWTVVDGYRQVFTFPVPDHVFVRMYVNQLDNEPGEDTRLQCTVDMRKDPESMTVVQAPTFKNASNAI